MKIGLFLPNWLGDLAMATPAIRALRGHFGRGARLVGILRPNLFEVLAGTDWLDEQWAFDPHGDQPEHGQWAMVRRMRQERFDLVVLLVNSLRSAALAWLGGAARRIGYVRSLRGPLLTGRVYPRRSGGRILPEPMVDYYLRLAEAAGCPAESKRLELGLTAEENARADAVWRNLGLRTDGRVIAFNSSGAYGAAKLWPAEHFAQLARQVVDRYDHDVLVVCGPQERDQAAQIVQWAGRERVFSLAGQTLGIGLSKGCIRRCRMMVSTDSGPRHVAAAYGLPVVTLLGPTQPIWIENPTVRAVDLQLELDCIGCRQRRCPRGHHRCMRELSVDRVEAAVAGLLDPAETAVRAA